MAVIGMRLARSVRRLSSAGARRHLSSAADDWSIAGQSREGRAIYLDRCAVPVASGGGSLPLLPGTKLIVLYPSAFLSQATTPMDPRVLDAMLPYMTGRYGNPHSVTHMYGWESLGVVDTAREQVAALIGAEAKEVIFTSGATESNNLAVKGVGRFQTAKRHVVTTVTEHKCVLDSGRALEREGFDVTYLPVGSDGLVDLAMLEGAIRPDTSLVSVMHVNNEIGVIQPIAEVDAFAARRKCTSTWMRHKPWGRSPST